MSNHYVVKRLVFVTLALAASAVNAAVIPIDLNDFFADPEVTIAMDGSFASFEESAFAGAVILSNLPPFDPEVVVAGPGTLLKFEFDFAEGIANDDAFFAAVLDEFGFAIPGFEVFIEDSAAGTVTFDLSTLVAEPLLGLQFELVRFDSLFDSALIISDVRLETPAGIDEPFTVLLLLGGMLGVLGLARRKNTA